MSNIKELMRREIERLKSKYRHNGLWTSSFQSDLAMAKIESMNELLSFLDTLEEPVEKTCKTCGFYENNCPFIRGKFIPYPSKVCKDFTFSVIKEEDGQ